jgi:TolB-like protein/Tfp pilus assembly protein PilF
VEVFDQIGNWVSQNESLFSGLAALVALIAIVPAALRPMLRRRRDSEGSRTSSFGRQKPKADRATRPRLAVFPVETTGTNDALRTVSEIVTVELTTLLARSNGCEVISRRSATAFALDGGTTSDAESALDVRYVVEGQLSDAGSGLRIRADLIDTTRDKIVWSDSFETQDDDIGAISQSLAEKIAAHLDIELTRAEVGRARSQPRNREARDLVLRAQGILFDEGHSRDSFERAIDLLTQAVAKDRDYADAHGLLALLFSLGHVFGFFDSKGAGRENSLRACERAMEIDDRSSDVLGYVGCAYCDLKQYEQGVALLERAIELNPSNAQAKAALGTAFVGLGRLEEGAARIEEALRLTPAYKGIAPWATVLSGAYLRLGQLDDASASIEQALRCDPRFFPTHLSAALIALRNADPAAAERHAREAKRIYPGLSPQTSERIVGRRAAGLLAPWLDGEDRLA